MARLIRCWLFSCTLLTFNELGGQTPALLLPTQVLPVAQFFKPRLLGLPHFSALFFSRKLNVPATPTRPSLPKWTPDCLPFFCKIEYRILKQVAVPFKFRLGSVDYVDWLEGKDRFDNF